MRRRLISVLCLASAMVAAGLPAVANGQATPVHSKFSTPFDFEGFNPCNGEFVLFSGRLSTQGTFVEDGSGGFHFEAHQLLTGQGEGSFGNRYTFNDVLSQSFYSSEGVPQTFTQMITDKTISKGSESNFVILVLFHMTINANGEVTTEVFHLNTECRG